MNTKDARDFRFALGQFATGVTVITTTGLEGEPVGVTASSFNSVSLDPPLVLWSLARAARSMEAFQQSGYFCVNVLGASQESTSQRFASAGTDKFAGLDWTQGEGGVPRLHEYAAQFQCRTTYQYDGGDHVIFVGEVLQYDRTDEPPLVFHRGRYALARSKAGGQGPGEAVDVAQGTFTESFLLYLLARAHYQATAPLRREWRAAGIDEIQYLALTVLGLGGPLSLQELGERLDHTGHAPGPSAMRAMEDRGLVTETPDGARYTLTVKGRELYIGLLARSKAIEEDLLAGFSAAEVEDVRDFLHRFVHKTDPGVPDLWQPGRD